MKITFNYSKRDPSKSLEELVSQKLIKLEKYVRGEAVADVYFKADGKEHSMKVVANLNGRDYAAHSSSSDMYKNIDSCMKRIKTQLIKSKSDYRTDSRKVNKKVEFSEKHNIEQFVPITDLE